MLETKLHERLASPWRAFIVVFIALPFGAATGRRNVYVGRRQQHPDLFWLLRSGADRTLIGARPARSGLLCGVDAELVLRRFSDLSSLPHSLKSQPLPQMTRFNPCSVRMPAVSDLLTELQQKYERLSLLTTLATLSIHTLDPHQPAIDSAPKQSA